jgi:Protein of unknown function with PCYCGC motif
MKKVFIVALIFLGAALVVVTISSRETEEQRPSTTSPSSSRETPVANHNHEATDRIPAYYKTAPAANTLPPTLPPDVFAGNVRLAYLAAKDIPETLAQIPCYCHCDMSKGHKSLHTCFEDQHGENCGICIGEALMAHNLQKQGLTPTQIRERVIQAYGGK